MPLPPTYKFRSIPALIGLYTKFGSDPYARKQQPYMENYLLDPRCQISNNLAENAIRPFTVGRKNWLFSDTVKGAKASAVIYSLVETAGANGLSERGYLHIVLSNLPSMDFRQHPELLKDLMPWSVSAPRNSVLAKPSLPVRKSFHGVAVYF